MPSGPGVIPLDDIASIIKQLPPKTKSVLLTSAQTAQSIYSQHSQVNSWGIQIVDYVNISELVNLRAILPDVQLLQVIHVQDASSIQLALKYSQYVDFLLLDSGNPNSTLKTLGGTGEVHDWEISREICDKSSIPVFLAGGLNTGNILAALAATRPDGVDLCSGLRTDDGLQKDKIIDFFKVLEVAC
jgi:phosphoribosylanthranilate isomerase